MEINSYRDLKVWQRSIDMVAECYRMALLFPDHERFGLSGQLRRAAVSVPANIAEGRGRDGTKEFIHQLSIAYGSFCECETHIVIAVRLNYITDQQSQAIMAEMSEIGRMINPLKNSLHRRLAEPSA